MKSRRWIAAAVVSLALTTAIGLLSPRYGCRASGQEANPERGQEVDAPGAAGGSRWWTSVLPSTGKPNQVIHVGNPGIGLAVGPITVDVYDEDGKLTSWGRVTSLENVGPEARAYELQPLHDGTVLIRFGDGEHGARPPEGEPGVRVRHVGGSGQTTTLETGPTSFRRVGTINGARGTVWDHTADALRQHAAERVFEVITLREVNDGDTEYRLYEVPGDRLHAFLVEEDWLVEGEIVASVGPRD